MGRLQGLLVVAACWMCASSASAGGFDTPILYGARHIGVGGAAVGYVDDPSAIYHNPAGLTGVKGLAITANLSPLLATLRTSPGEPNGNLGNALYNGNEWPTREAEPIVAPAFLLGAAYRLSDWMVFGLGVFPLASATAEYKMTQEDLSMPLCDDPPCGPGEYGGVPWVDRARVVFIELSPINLAFDLPLGLSVGAGLRLTMASFERTKGVEADPRLADADLSGPGCFDLGVLPMGDCLGFRAGVQWRYFDWVSAGLTYRHTVTPNVEADVGRLPPGEFRDVSAEFTVPARLSGGVRFQFWDWALALDAHYGFNSQMQELDIQGTDAAGRPGGLLIPFDWKDSVTVQGGLEYPLLAGRLPVRVGYAFDGETASKRYPSAFGTPPAASHSFTAGVGYRANNWQLNAAGAYRTMNTSVSPADVENNGCDELCGKAGSEYSLSLIGLYLDFSIDLEVASLF